MRYRKVGRSSLEVSEIAFGTGDTAGGIVYGSSREQAALVEAALEAGITLFDCSPDYGKGMGEANLGRVLKDIGAPDVTIVTKVEIMPEDMSRIGDKIRESLHDSLLRLRRDHVDVLMLHNPCRAMRDPAIRVWTPLTPDDILDQVLPVFAELRQAGKTRFLGLACESAHVPSVHRVLATREFTLVNAWYNLVNPSAATPVSGLAVNRNYDGLFAATAEFGVGVAVIRPLAGGALTSAMIGGGEAARNPLSRPLRHDPKRILPDIQRARPFAYLERPGVRTLSEAAYRFVLASRAVSSIVGGFSEPSHIAEAAMCSERGPLDADELAEIQDIFRRER